MRKTNHVPWMGRTVVMAIVALVGLGVFAVPAQAQNEALVLDNVGGWWNHLDCEMKINAVNAIAGLDTDHPVLAEADPGEVYSTTANDSTRQWCHDMADLGQNEQRALDAGAMQSRTDGGITTKASDRVFDMAGWWDGMIDEGRMMAIGDATAPTATVAAATTAVANEITAAFESLMGGMMTTDDDDDDEEEEEAPALPLVGVGILGLLLAGRGAWLRRRS